MSIFYPFFEFSIFYARTKFNVNVSCWDYYCAYPYPCLQYVGFTGYLQYKKSNLFFLLFILVLCYIHKNSFVNYQIIKNCQTTTNCEKLFYHQLYYVSSMIRFVETYMY